MLDTVSNNKHVERLSNENISAQDRQYKVSSIFKNQIIALDIVYSLKDMLIYISEWNAGCHGEVVGI